MTGEPAIAPDAGTHDGIPKGRGRLQGKVALVMGGSSILPGWGNGKAAAVLFAVEGAKVFVVDHREAAAEETVGIIEQAGGHAIAAAGDAAYEKDVARVVAACLVAACLAKLGRIDVLHNNVGGQGTGHALETITLDDWNEYKGPQRDVGDAVVPRGGAGHAEAGRRRDRQRLLDRLVAPSQYAYGGLCRRQRCNQCVHTEHRAAVCRPRHPRQLRADGRHRYAVL